MNCEQKAKLLVLEKLQTIAKMLRLWLRKTFIIIIKVYFN